MISYRLSHKNAKIKVGRQGDAGIDLYNPYGQTILPPNVPLRIRTGVHFYSPKGYFGEIKGRSGLALKGVLVLGGVVDSGYTGEISVVLVNVSQESLIVPHEHAIAQIIFQPCVIPAQVPVIQVAQGKNTERGAQGFGSSDV